MGRSGAVFARTTKTITTRSRATRMFEGAINSCIAIRRLSRLALDSRSLQVFSMLLRKTRSVNLLIPNLPKHAVDQETYEGATVIEPKKAFYEEPIATLDFASLYPSIMQVPHWPMGLMVSVVQL